MEPIIGRTVRPVAESHVRRTVALVVAEVAGARVERQPTDVSIAPDQSALGVGLVELMESVPQSRLRNLAVSEAALGDPRFRPATRSTQVLPAGIDAALQSQVDDASHKEGTLIYLPPTLSSGKSSHGEANVKKRHGKYDRGEDADKSRDGQELCDKREMIQMDSDTSSDGDGSAGDEKRRKKETKKKERSRKGAAKPERETSRVMPRVHPTQRCPKLRRK